MTSLGREPQLLTLVPVYADLSSIILPSAQKLVTLAAFLFFELDKLPHQSLCPEHSAQIFQRDVTSPSALITILKQPHTHVPDVLRRLPLPVSSTGHPTFAFFIHLACGLFHLSIPPS